MIEREIDKAIGMYFMCIRCFIVVISMNFMILRHVYHEYFSDNICNIVNYSYFNCLYSINLLFTTIVTVKYNINIFIKKIERVQLSFWPILFLMA